ncbi:MAG: FAD-linked oxidase C-terminal domain-containing protein [Bilophila wadsworthia]
MARPKITSWAEVFANTGDLVKTGSHTVNRHGLQRAPLLVGSGPRDPQGTLKLIPPPRLQGHDGPVQDMDGASQAVAGIIAAHVVPCTLEFLDHASINYVKTTENRPRCRAILLIEVDGHPAQVEDEAVIVEKVLRDNSATEIVVAAPWKEPVWKPAAWPFQRPAAVHADAGRRRCRAPRSRL